MIRRVSHQSLKASNALYVDAHLRFKVKSFKDPTNTRADWRMEKPDLRGCESASALRALTYVSPNILVDARVGINWVWMIFKSEMFYMQRWPLIALHVRGSAEVGAFAV